ncbi:MAG: hypothetical protein AB8G17_09255 [Gammaproteobacteria bacterium]
MRRIAPIILLSIMASGAHAATLSYADISRARSAPEVQAKMAAIQDHAAAAHVDALVALAADALSDQALTPAKRELLLAQTANALAALPATSATEALLGTLTTFPTQTWLKHEHGTASHRVPAFDVPAAARFALRQHANRRQAETFAQHLNDRNATAHWTNIPQSRSALQKQSEAAFTNRGSVATQAAKMLSADRLSETLPELLGALPTAPHLAGAAMHAAETLRDPAPLLAVITHASNQDALVALGAAGKMPNSATRLRVIDAAIARPDTASAALVALAEHVRVTPADTPRLLAWLAQPDTAMATAHAVAKLDRPDIAADLGERLLDESDWRQATALALALTLMRNDTAGEQLRRYMAAEDGVPELKRKLRATISKVSP